MAASYEYDETGQSSFFILTFLLFVLIPWTLSSLRSSGTKPALPPHPAWNRKDEQVCKVRRRTSTVLTKNRLGLVVGWVLAAYVAYVASGVKGSTSVYDPFEILGIKAGLDEKAIKKHYKRLSLKFHPDKLRNADNTTIEEANAKFVNLTKAYKALTDETVRKNLELYGHPDGKQDTSMGIALPKWIVDSQNNGYVIGLYGLAFGILLPFFVSRWWSGSRKLTKDQVLTSTAATYFMSLKEESTFEELLQILALSDEFRSGFKGDSKSRGIDGLEREVKEKLTELGIKDERKLVKGKSWAVRALTFLYAHLLRIRINDAALLKEKQNVIEKAHHLTNGLSSIALAHNWLSTLICIIALQQALVQALHPRLPPLLQLPGLEVEDALRARKESGLATVEDFEELEEKEKDKWFGDVGPDTLAQATGVARKWPQVELVSAQFKVVGEPIVTPGAVIQFTIKLRLTPPGSLPLARSEPNGVVIDSSAGEGAIQGEDPSIDELLGRKQKGADGDVPVPLAHAPHFPGDRKPSYALFVGDHKLNRVFVPPSQFTALGYDQVRTVRVTFQAPQGPGLYTFQAYVKSDVYIGTDTQVSMQLRVEPPPAPGTVGAEDVEDDISEPDEDTLAGQMAAMKGLPTKKRAEEDDDDTSGTEESEDTDSESSWGSDSD